jgi:hypothetical protein
VNVEIQKGRFASLLMVIVAVSTGDCERRATPPPQTSSRAMPAGHEHHPPHGGTLIELGDEAAHIEVVLDRSAGSLTAYVLDGEAEESVRIPQHSLDLVIDGPQAAGRVLQLAARANVLTGETVGDSSEFSATDKTLQTTGRIKGQVSHIQVRGQVFDGIAFEVAGS